jgi:hypothetical protein
MVLFLRTIEREKNASAVSAICLLAGSAVITGQAIALGPARDTDDTNKAKRDMTRR